MKNGFNPLVDLIDDETYQILSQLGLLNEIKVRDYSIQKEFRALRKKKISAGDAIEQIRNEYPYLQFDTIRKIVYTPNGN